MLINNKLLVKYLKQITINASISEKLKIRYRPYICPFNLLLEKITSGTVIADIGCGSGQFLLLASHFCQPAGVIGIEIADRLVDNANTLFRERGEVPAVFQKYDGTDFPPQVFTADLIFLIDVLHHVPPAAQDRFLQTIISGMKKGSRLLLKDIDAGSPLVIANKMHDMVFGGGAGHERKPADLEKVIQKAGGEIADIQKMNTLVYPHYLIEVIKP